MKQFKKIMFSLLVIIMLLCTFIIKTEVKAQTSTEPQLTVYKNNVSYKDSVYFMYAVSYENIDITQYDIELLFWNTKQDTYTKGTEKYYKEVSRTQTITGVDCVIYYSEGIAAKNIVDDIYTRAYVKIGDKEYYSEVNKTSVVDYLLRMIESGTLNTNQKNLFNALLAYGAAAQNNFDYKTDQLATATYYKVNVVNGVISDGFTYGRYKENTTITIIANDIIDNDFVNWTNSLGDIVSTDKEYQFEVTESETYTANYKISETHICSYKEILATATCTTAGSIYYECPVCGNQYSEYVGVLPHTYENGNCTVCGEAEASEGLFFMLNSDSTGYIVNDYGTFEGKDLVIPSSYNSKPVVGISDSAFNGCNFIETVTMPNTILTIGMNAFYNCTSLKSITITESVTSIGYNAFYNCTNLATINFNAINCSDCSSSGVFINVGKNATRTTLKIGNNVTRIPGYLMYYSYYIDILTFENNSVCEEIGGYAFYGCEELKNVNLPNSVNTIGNCAFKSCDSLLSFVGGTGLDTIGESAFESSPLLYNVSVPTTLTKIGKKAFAECTSLSSFTIPSSIESIGEYAFQSCACSLTWDNPSITRLDNYAFANYYGTSFDIPNSVVEIGEFTFSGARYLEKIEFGPNLKVIGKGAFENCYSITEIYVPQNVTTINAGAFNGCRSIVDITLPFVGESLKPSNSYQSVFGYIFGYEYHNAGYTTPTSKSGLVFQISVASFTYTYKYYYYIPASIKTITIMPVESYDLPANAFYGLKDQITKITLCDNFVKIKDSAFSSAKISTVELPSSLNYIKDNSFKDSSVTSVIFKDPNGWSADSKTLSTTDLSDPTIAANYLKNGRYDSGYCHCIWNKIIS